MAQPSFRSLPYVQAELEAKRAEKERKTSAIRGIGSGVLGVAQGIKSGKEDAIRFGQAKQSRAALIKMLYAIKEKNPEKWAEIGVDDPMQAVPPLDKKKDAGSYLKTVNTALSTLIGSGLRSKVFSMDEVSQITGLSPNSPGLMKLISPAMEKRAAEEKALQEQQQLGKSQQAMGQASQQAVGAQFEEQSPSPQLAADIGFQQQTGDQSGAPSQSQQLGITAPPPMSPSMVTQGEAQTRPEAQQRVGQALGNIGAPPDDIQKQQQIAGAGLPQQAPGPDDALMRDVEAKGGLSKPLGANTFIVGKTEQLGQAESKAKNIKKLITQITKDPQLMSNPEKRMKFVADAKPLGLWDDETGPASNEMMAEMLTAAEEHAEQIKGEIKEAEAEKKMAVLGKPKTATPKMATPMSASAAEAKLNNEVNKRLRMMFPNDVEEILHPYTKAVTGYRVLPNSKASQMISTPNKFAQFAQQYFPQLSKSAQVRGGATAPAVNDDPEGLFE